MECVFNRIVGLLWRLNRIGFTSLLAGNTVGHPVPVCGSPTAVLSWQGMIGLKHASMPVQLAGFDWASETSSKFPLN